MTRISEFTDEERETVDFYPLDDTLLKYDSRLSQLSAYPTAWKLFLAHPTRVIDTIV